MKLALAWVGEDHQMTVLMTQGRRCGFRQTVQGAHIQPCPEPVPPKTDHEPSSEWACLGVVLLLPALWRHYEAGTRKMMRRAYYLAMHYVKDSLALIHEV